MGRDLRILLSALALILLAACAKRPAVSPQPPPDGAVAVPSAGLSGTVVAVNIYDERRSVSEPGRILHMPETTFVGQEDQVYPPLDDSVRAVIRNEVAGEITAGVERFEVDVYVTAGRQSFLVGEMREVTEVRFAVRIEVIAADDVRDVRAGEGTVVMSSEGIDVPRSNVDALYMEAVRESIRRGFLKIAG